MKKRKRNKNKSFSSKYILLILTAICVVIIVLSASSKITTGMLGQVVGQVIVPMQKGLNKIGSGLTAKEVLFTSKAELVEENEELKSQVSQLESQIDRSAGDQKELEELRSLYDMSEDYSDYDTVGATIVSKDSSNWFSVFIVDKGSKDGIEIGNNVIADGGLVGIVTDVGNNWAKVRSIIDDTSNVSATIVSTKDNCIVSGNLQTMNELMQLELSDLNDEDGKVKEGDQIVTSAISDKYLEGIPIGYVTDITTDSNKLTRSGHLATIVDFKHLNKVLIIQAVKDYPNAE